jgi:hypothetical protein
VQAFWNGAQAWLVDEQLCARGDDLYSYAFLNNTIV